MRYNILYSCASHIGSVRSINQDNFICDGRYMEVDGKSMKFPFSGTRSSKEFSLFGIFDGMGGEECGEVAALIAAKNAAAAKIGRDAASDLLKFCEKANAEICTYAEENGISAMGTTAAMLAFTEDEISLCNIGDSKIFRFCGGNLEQISVDHVDIPIFGKKPPLLQNLGIPPDKMVIEPYVAQGAYHDGDIYLICSDGLTDMVANEDIADTLTSGTTEEAIQSLLQKALSNGGRDNISMIVCKIQRESGWPFSRKRSDKKKEG